MPQIDNILTTRDILLEIRSDQREFRTEQKAYGVEQRELRTEIHAVQREIVTIKKDVQYMPYQIIPFLLTALIGMVAAMKALQWLLQKLRRTNGNEVVT